MLLDFLFQFLWVAALHAVDFGAVSEEDKRRHGRHAIARRRLRTLVHVHLEEHGARIPTRQLLEEWRYPLARTAPGFIF